MRIGRVKKEVEENRFRKELLVFLLFFSLTGTPLQAIVFDGVQSQFAQPNGITFIGRMFGDAFDLRMETLDGYVFVRNDEDGYYRYAVLGPDGDYLPSSLKVRIDDPEKSGVPKHLRRSESVLARIQQDREERFTTFDQHIDPFGEVSMGIIFIQFSDWQDTVESRGGVRTVPPYGFYTFKDYWDLFFSEGEYISPSRFSPDGDTVFGSVRDYWLEVSYNNLTIAPGGDPSLPPGERGILNPLDGNGNPIWYTMPYTKEFYKNIQPWDTLTDAALDSARAHGFDLDSLYDVICVIYAGSQEPGNGALIPHAFSRKTPWNGWDSFIMAEKSFRPESEFSHIGVPAHEFGHTLGLSDLHRIYTFDLMGNGWRGFEASRYDWGGSARPVHLSAFSKIKLGYIDPINFTQDTPNATLFNVEENPVCWRLWKNGEKNYDNEHFLVENRQNIGFDRDFSEEHGLVIYHVYNNGWTPDVEEADGLGNENGGDFGDFFPGTTGNTRFGVFTNPNSNSYSGNRITWVVVDSVEAIGRKAMKADVYVTPPYPYIVMLDFLVDTSAGVGNGDRRFQQGESVELLVTLANYGRTTDSVEVILSSSDSCITIQNPVFIIDRFEEDDWYSNAFDPFIIMASSSCSPGHWSDFQLRFIDSDQPRQDTFSVLIEMPQQKGYPVSCGNARSSPKMADLDGDGEPEVVFLSSNDQWGNPGGICVIRGKDGTLFWRNNLYAFGSPAIGDVDGDRSPEVVVVSGLGLSVFDGEDGRIFRTFSKSSLYSMISSPALGDIDGDGILDIVFVDKDTVYALNCLQGAFRVLPGWPQTVAPFDYGIVIPDPALADIDGDGELEIVVGSQGGLYAWNGDGSPIPLPESDYSITTSPVIGDLDGNGSLEIVSIANDRFSPSLRVHFLYSNQWLVEEILEGTYYYPPILADLDEDGEPEIIGVSGDTLIFAVKRDGSSVTGWPIQYPYPYIYTTSPIVADFDGDGHVDVILSDGSSRQMYAWDRFGAPLFDDSNPAFATILFSDPSSPLIGDVDEDGYVELLFSANLFNTWDSPGRYRPEKVEWGEFRHDLRNTGLYTKPSSGIPISYRIFQNSPNPFQSSTTYIIQTSIESHISLSAYNILGQRVRRLLDEEKEAGLYAIVWDGKDDLGNKLASGIYFMRMVGSRGGKENDFVSVKKSILLR